jgi:alpha-methylacyl-CoA racemase
MSHRILASQTETCMGPLKGFVIIELAGIGPAPFAGMLLADMGATVIRVDRRDAADLGVPGRLAKFDVLARGRQSIGVDLKSADGTAVVKRLVAKADALIEGFRPGVLERLGLGPDVLSAVNPRLVIGRMTGYGQEGPMADRAGHDINYISLAGVLHTIGRKGEAPVPPLNLVGDFGGGGMFLAFGVVAALLEAMIYGFRSGGQWQDQRGVNVIDTGAPWYEVYETSDHKWLAVGAIEARFYAELLKGLALDPKALPKQHDRTRWPELRATFAKTIKAKTRDVWVATFAGMDACVTPVLALDEVADDPHMAARATLQTRDGVKAPEPAPRFSRTQAKAGGVAREAGIDTNIVLADFGFSADEIASLDAKGVVGRPVA